MCPGGWLFASSSDATISVMGDSDAAQAVELIRALCDQLHKMTDQLAWVERQDVTRRNGRACAMRLQAAALRRDIRKAQVLIDRLQRRYFSDDTRVQQGPAAGRSRAMRMAMLGRM